ncbi:MAG: response regulator transcription factor [Myxococcota bacterium]
MTRTVGLVEDDDVIRENYADFLTSRGFSVRQFADRHSAARSFAAQQPDVAVLDVALGDERDGGFILCAELRRSCPKLPVIFLTSYDGDTDRISGLRVGGDDYLSKDSSLEFLAVRIETLLHRHDTLLEGAAPGPPEIEVGPLTLDSRRATVAWKGQQVALSLTHYWIVSALATDPSEAKNPQQLMDAASIHVAPNTIAAHIRAIRARFRAQDPTFDAIRTERGRGYRWLPDPDDPSDP